MAESPTQILASMGQMGTPARGVAPDYAGDDISRTAAKTRAVQQSLEAQRIRHGQSPDKRPSWQTGGSLIPRTVVKAPRRAPTMPIAEEAALAKYGSAVTARTPQRPVPSLGGMRRRRGGGLLIRQPPAAATAAYTVPSPVAEESTQLSFDTPPNVRTERGPAARGSQTGISGLWTAERSPEASTQGELSPIGHSESRIESVGARFDEHAQGKESFTIGDLIGMFTHHADSMKQELAQQAAEHSGRLASPDDHGALEEAMQSVEGAVHTFMGRISSAPRALRPTRGPPAPTKILRRQEGPPPPTRILRRQEGPPPPPPPSPRILRARDGPPAQYRSQRGTGSQSYPYGGRQPRRIAEPGKSRAGWVVH